MNNKYIPKKIQSFIKTNIVMVIAMFLAIITTIFVPVDKKYVGYFDFKTLTCLFCVLSVVCALKNINFFYILARNVVQRFKTARLAVSALVYITFIGSMLIANDMALLTFLPLGYFVLTSTKKEQGLHGIGINSIKSSVDRLGGLVSFDYEDGIFKLNIMVRNCLLI